ncbi:LuxR C-terminal-related transcriptional regulator [Streptomyces olivaceoviridis]|uniref:LuxR C-terminal-related transcriptional regulator n=1 Tax=Streptomyces olivaceoviridis TaxID=1921 RepID=UPI003316A46B
MTTTDTAKVTLAPREQQVLEGLADGNTLAEVAGRLNIGEGTASGYVQLAKRKLHQVRETPAALAVAYATRAIPEPEAHDPEGLGLPTEQRALLPLIAQGLSAIQMATELKRPVADVRSDYRALIASLRARNRTHLIKRAWQYQLLTAHQVRTWIGLPSNSAVPDKAHSSARPSTGI